MDPLCSQRQKSQNPLSASPTADSLDLPRLLASDRIQPLISESITFDTLSSSSSDQVAPFSTCKPPRLSIIGLGDHLKMFSGPLSQLQDGVKSKIVITSPTSPRLKSMFKECLCISKWAVSLFNLPVNSRQYLIHFTFEGMFDWLASTWAHSMGKSLGPEHRR